MKVIGLIGGCGTGKSEVLNILKDNFNAYVIVADKIGHEIILKGEKPYELIVEHFGQQILNEDGEINRKALGKIVFSDKDMLMKLNSMTHPYMHQRIERVIREEKAKGQYDLIVLEAAVMIEAKFNELANEMWFITCDIDTRIERLMTYRKLEKDRIINIISRQHSDEFYEKHADYTINNSGTIENTYKQIERLLKE